MLEKADSELVRRQNRGLVLEALRRHGALGRLELGKATGLSPASITAITAQMLVDGILVELASPFPLPASLKRGRPIVRLGLRGEAAQVLAITLAIDAVSFTLADFSGRTLAATELHMPTYTAPPESFGHELAQAAKSFLEASDGPQQPVAHIGLAVQGMADASRGEVIWSPAFAQRHVQLVEPLRKVLQAPCLIANDTNLMAEGFRSSAKSRQNAACIFIGFGVGLGLILDGRVYYGPHGGSAEWGHMNYLPHGALCRCGTRGCIEAYASDYGILRQVNGDTHSTPPHSAVPAEVMSRLISDADAGEAKARAAFATAGTALGFGIARLLSVLPLAQVILSGPGLVAQHLLEPSLRQAVEDGLMEDLRRDLVIEFVPYDTNYVVRGTVAALLRQVDNRLAGTLARSSTSASSKPVTRALLP